MIVASTIQLHIPDGFLSLGMAAAAWIVALLILFLAIRRSQEDFDERLVPLAGIMAAFIFAGQMINFPVAGGTSGHLLGAALAAVVLGPWLGILVMTAVIALQGLLFQDGGLVVMGANILIMGIVPVLISFGFYRAVAGRARAVKLGVMAVAAWLSVMGAALVTALLLGFSGTSSFRIVVPAMLGIHALIGVGEALITVAALGFILNARPQLLEQSAGAGGRGWILAGLATAVLVVFVSPFASGFPDGLEWVAAQNAFLDAGRAAPYQLLPGYTVPFLGKGPLSTIVAGLAGVLLVVAVVWVTARLLRRGGRLEAGD